MPITVILLIVLLLSVLLGIWGVVARSRVLKIVEGALGGVALLLLAVIFVFLGRM